jgi:hypothetical protein
MPLLTIFSAPKPFTNPHIATIQRNAIRSWTMLGPEVEVILLGQETGLSEAAAELGVRHLPEVERNANGTPLVSSMFDLARRSSDAELLCCVNADILLLPEIVTQAGRVRELIAAGRRDASFLIVGQRWDLEVSEELDFSPGWDERLRRRAQQQGKLHRAAGSDYFIFPRQSYTHMPAFAIGRAGWDNWMIYAGRSAGWPVIDASQSITIIHQNHDYSHLPGGLPHYNLPETDENVRLAGGKRAILMLSDASHCLVEGRIARRGMDWKRFWHEVEIFPILSLRSPLLAEVFYFLFHPLRAYREWRWEARGKQ